MFCISDPLVSRNNLKSRNKSNFTCGYTNKVPNSGSRSLAGLNECLNSPPPKKRGGLKSSNFFFWTDRFLSKIIVSSKWPATHERPRGPQNALLAVSTELSNDRTHPCHCQSSWRATWPDVAARGAGGAWDDTDGTDASYWLVETCHRWCCWLGTFRQCPSICLTWQSSELWPSARSNMDRLKEIEMYVVPLRMIQN